METTALPAVLANYMDRVRRGLRVLPDAEREDVLRELTAHLEDALATGRTPEALIAGLGAPETMAASLVQERLVTVDRRRSPAELANKVLKAILWPLVGTVVAVTALLVAFYWYALSNLGPGWQDQALLLFLLLPAIAAAALPAAMFLLGLVGLPRLAQELSASTRRRVLPGVFAVVLLLGAGTTGLNFWLHDHAAPAANAGIHAVLERNDPGLASKRSKPALEPRVQAYEAQRRLARPTYPLVMTVLGLALGLALFGFRLLTAMALPLFLTAALGFHLLEELSHRLALELPWSGAVAWLPTACALVAALVIWAGARLAGRGLHADL